MKKYFNNPFVFCRTMHISNSYKTSSVTLLKVTITTCSMFLHPNLLIFAVLKEKCKQTQDSYEFHEPCIQITEKSTKVFLFPGKCCWYRLQVVLCPFIKVSNVVCQMCFVDDFKFITPEAT